MAAHLGTTSDEEPRPAACRLHHRVAAWPRPTSHLAETGLRLRVDVPAQGEARRRFVALALSTLAVLGVVIAGQPLLGDGSSGDGGDTEVLGVQRSRSASASGGPDPAGSGGADLDFTIAGRLEGAVPGEPSALVLTVAHQHGSAIVVRTIEVRVGDPNTDTHPGPPCLAEHLELAGFSGPQRIDARSEATVEVSATLANDAPEACRTAHFPLAFSGTAILDAGP